jgi:hypothetical protein
VQVVASNPPLPKPAAEAPPATPENPLEPSPALPPALGLSWLVNDAPHDA